MNDILFCLDHTQIYRYRYDLVLSTWGQDVPIQFYSDYQADNVIQVSEDTSFHSGEEKHVNFINHLLATELKYNWYFFCDDDTFVNTKLLLSILPKFASDKAYGQIIYCWSEDWDLGYFSGGAGWLINKELLITMKPVINHKTFHSDVCLGIHMKNLGIPMVHDERFRGQLPEFYSIPESDIIKFITFHNAKMHCDMQRLYAICQDQ